MTKFEDAKGVAVFVYISKDEVEACSNNVELERLVEFHTRAAKQALNESIYEKYPELK